MSDLGTEIRDARMARNMSQKVLSTETKTLQEQINAMENGKPGFNKDKIKFVLDYLGVEATPMKITKYHERCHGLVHAPPTVEKTEEFSEEAASIIKEIEALKDEIEEWLKRDNKGIKGWISAVDSARKLFNKVLEII